MTCQHCEELQERVRQLEAELYGAAWEPPRELGLTLHERTYLQTLMARPWTVPVAILFDATRRMPGSWGHDIDDKVVCVHISKIRRKLKPFGLNVENVFGVGYRLPLETRASLLNWQQQEAA